VFVAAAAMEKTLMPETTVAAPDGVEARFTNREDNSTRAELQSKFVAKEVYKLSENLYEDSTVEKPYMPDATQHNEGAGIATSGLSKRRNELEAAEAAGGHDGRTLWEQLNANKEKKDEEWKTVNNPFAPPTGLEDDEVEYIDGIEDQKREAEKRKKQQIVDDAAAFKAAQAKRVVPSAGLAAAGGPGSGEQQAPKSLFKAAATLTAGKSRPRLGGLGAIKPRGAADSAPPQKRAKLEEASAAGAAGGGLLSGLGDYGSDSSDSDD
jgi:hypothetical protein